MANFQPMVYEQKVSMQYPVISSKLGLLLTFLPTLPAFLMPFWSLFFSPFLFSENWQDLGQQYGSEMEAPCRENCCQSSPGYFWHYPRRVSHPHSLPILGTHHALHEDRDMYTVYPQPGKIIPKKMIGSQKIQGPPCLSTFQYYSNSGVCRSHILAL